MKKSVLLFLFGLSYSSNFAATTCCNPYPPDSLAPGTVLVRYLQALNSPERELAPAYYEQGIVFVSNKKQRGSRQKNGEAYFDLYFSPFDLNGDPGIAQDFSINLNINENEGPVTFSADFKTLYYTQSNNRNGVAKAGKDGIVHLKIFRAVRGKHDWKPQGELPFCSEDYSCMAPALSPDGKRLYFASDMPGGFGGYDLYYSTCDTAGNFSAPVNLGPGINTELDDLSPFISHRNTLFFASAGHQGLGGRDLFYVPVSPAGFGEVVHLGAPFNTAADELNIILDDQEESGFFVSDRDGGVGKSDIYKFIIVSKK